MNPQRTIMNKIEEEARSLLALMLGEGACFRPGQWEAIEALVARRERLLLVQSSGWGKSLVYFLATKMLRQRVEVERAAEREASPVVDDFDPEIRPRHRQLHADGGCLSVSGSIDHSFLGEMIHVVA
jgi:hypothetical protein